MIHNTSLRGVVLDIDGTIISLTKGVGEIYAELLQERGLQSDPVTLERVARRVWVEFQPLYLNTAGGYRTTYDRERGVWLSYVRRVLSEGGVSHAEEPSISEGIYDAFASARFRTIEPGVKSFLQTAHALGVSAFAATNNDSRSKSVLSAVGLADLFQGTYVAGDLGWKKPSAEFFLALQRATRLEPTQLLHIGNDARLDVEMARVCGWEAALYDPKGRGVEPMFRHFDQLTEALAASCSR